VRVWREFVCVWHVVYVHERGETRMRDLLETVFQLT